MELGSLPTQRYIFERNTGVVAVFYMMFCVAICLVDLVARGAIGVMYVTV